MSPGVVVTVVSAHSGSLYFYTQVYILQQQFFPLPAFYTISGVTYASSALCAIDETFPIFRLSWQKLFIVNTLAHLWLTSVCLFCLHNCASVFLFSVLKGSVTSLCTHFYTGFLKEKKTTTLVVWKDGSAVITGKSMFDYYELGKYKWKSL